MKKCVLLIVCSVALTFTVNAIELSAGIGADVGFIFSSVKTNLPESAEAELNAVLDGIDTTRWGISAFFDAQYIEANLGYKFLISSQDEVDFAIEQRVNFFNLGLKIKYPFTITEKIRVFPLVGFDYVFFINGKERYSETGSAISIARAERDDLYAPNINDRLSINLGIGGDFYVINNVYIRGEFNYTFLLNTEYQKDIIDQVEVQGYDLSIFQSGPVFKLAIGYRFFS